MYQYTPRYPKAFGHPAWSLYGFVNDALLQDLFWRKVQTDPALVARLATILDHNATQENKNIFLSDNTAISLHPESCGAYTTERPGRVNLLQGNSEDKQSILDAEQHPASCGYYLGPLFQQKCGWLPQNVYSNILQRLRVSLTQEDRYLFNRKACHNNVLMTDRDKANAMQAIERSVPIDFGFKKFRVYWYSTENGSTVFGIMYLFDDSGMVAKLPISAWQRVGNSTGNVVFDLLHPHHNCPLYDLHALSRWRGRSKYALICANEWTCETIKQDHTWIPKTFPVTTYSSVEMSDWASLGSMTPIIFPDDTVDGCYEAYKLFLVLQAQGLFPIFLKRQEKKATNQVQNIIKLAQDIYPIAFPSGECDLSTFAQHCRREFGVEPPQGILPQGQPLLELPGGESEPEPLLEGLLSLDDQMTIFAWRGVGKSLFSLLLALCFANGHKALNGRVYPSRKYRVLLIDGEMPPGKLKERARSIAKGLGLPEDAANNLIVRSSVAEKKNLVLDTEEGWLDLLPDLEQADIIIVDSLFKVIPTAMSSEYTAIKELNNFYSWCRRHGKTGIVVDHQGKSGHASFGSMGKDISVDAALQLKNSTHAIEATATKNRNFEFTDKPWIKYSIKNESDGMTFQPIGQVAIVSPTTALPAGEDEDIKNSNKRASTPDKPDIDQAILNYVKEHSDQAQGEVCDAIVDMGICKRAAAHSHYKALREEGKLTAPEEADITKQSDDEIC